MACVYAPIEDNKTAAEIIARYKVAKRKLFPAAPANVVKPRPPVVPVAVVYKPVEYTAEQATSFMERAHTALKFTSTSVTPLAEIVEACCMAAGTTQNEFRSDRRFKGIVAARQAFYFIAHHHNESSYSTIGRMSGGKHHATVMYGIEKAAAAKENPNSPLGRVVRDAIAILEGSK